MNSYITTFFGFLFAVCVAIVGLVEKGVISKDSVPGWLLTAAYVGAAVSVTGIGIAARDNGKSSEAVGAHKVPRGKQGRLFSFLILFFLPLVAFSGCARFSSRQVKTDADGTRTESHQTVTTFFDAKSDIAKLRASTTDKTQGLSVGSVNEESSGSNAVSLVDSAVSAAVSAAIKTTVKPAP